MHTFTRRDMVATGLVGASAPSSAFAQEPNVIGNGSLYAIGVVTANAEETARHYQRILGCVAGGLGEVLASVQPPPGAAPPPPPPPPPPRTGNASSGGVVEPNGQAVTFDMKVALLRDFYVKIFQPIGENGPYAEHLRRYGMSIQDCQIHVEGDMRALRNRLIEKGGRWVLGADSDFWAYLDFQETLGTTLEPITLLNRFPFAAAPGAVDPLGARPLTHIGFAVRDAESTARCFSEALGRPMPEIGRVRDLGFPQGVHSNRHAHLRVAHWRQGDVGIELVESVGSPTPWSEFIERQHGNAAYYITFDVGDRMEVTARQLQENGGRWVYGRDGGSEALFDFTDVLGLAIKITGH